MPSVTAGSVETEYQLGLVRDGAIQHFAGYLPGDQDESIAVVLTDIQPSKKVGKKGLNLTAIPFVPNGNLPGKYTERVAGSSAPLHGPGGVHGGESGLDPPTGVGVSDGG